MMRLLWRSLRTNGRHIVAVTAIFVGVTLAAAAEGFPTTAADPEERLEIVAYCIPPAHQLSLDRFREMVACGFSMGIPAERHFDMDDMQTMLDLAHEAGMKLFVNLPELLDDPEGVVMRFRDHPAVAGYFIIDEPTWGPDGWSKTQYVQTPVRDLDLGAIVDRIKAVDPDRPCYINLFPNIATSEQLGTPTYRDHVERFVEEVPGAEFISFDHYPIANYQVNPAWYENLEIISDVARENDLPFWAFALSSTHYAYTPATFSHLRLQMHVNLAYGAQALQYFPYWGPNQAHWFSPIHYDGTRGVLFDDVKRLNGDLQQLAPVFRGASVVEVGHTGIRQQWRPGVEDSPEPWDGDETPLTPGTQRYEPKAPIVELVAQGKDGAVVSTLQKGQDRYLAVVNKDYAHIMVLRIEFDDSRTIHLRKPDGSWRELEGPRFRTLVQPGDLVVLGWTDQ